MLELANVSIRAGTKSLIDECNLSVKSGELVCLHGANGAGKTTLLRSILGIKPVAQGVVKINNISVQAMTRKQIGALSGYLPQSISPPIGTLAVQFMDESVNIEAFERLAIAPLLNKDYFDLSGGERQRLLFCSILRDNLQLLILDEPLKSLDREYSGVVGDLLKKFTSKGGAIMMANHDNHWSSWYADRKLCISEKRLEECKL